MFESGVGGVSVAVQGEVTVRVPDILAHLLYIATCVDRPTTAGHKHITSRQLRLAINDVAVAGYICRGRPVSSVLVLMATTSKRTLASAAMVTVAVAIDMGGNALI